VARGGGGGGGGGGGHPMFAVNLEAQVGLLPLEISCFSSRV